MYYLLVALSYIVYVTPIQILSFFAWFLAFLAFDIFRLRRRVMLANLDIVFKDTISKSEKISVARSAHHNLALTAFEFLRSYHVPFKNITQMHGQQWPDDLYKQAKPAFIIIAHIGNWEVMAATLSSVYPNVLAVVKKVGSDSVNRFVARVRAKNGWQAVVKGESFGAASRKMVLGIKSNSFIGFPMDQRRNSDPAIPFFGQLSHTNHTLAILWMKYKTPILGAYSYRDRNYKHQMRFLPPLDLSQYEDCKDPSEITLVFNRLVERMILENPRQYLWQHKRWKRVSFPKDQVRKRPAKNAGLE